MKLKSFLLMIDLNLNFKFKSTNLSSKPVFFFFFFLSNDSKVMNVRSCINDGNIPNTYSQRERWKWNEWGCKLVWLVKREKSRKGGNEDKVRKERKWPFRCTRNLEVLPAGKHKMIGIRFYKMFVNNAIFKNL